MLAGLSVRTAEDIVRTILIERGIEGEEQQAIFLYPNFERDTHDILLAKDAEKLISRLIEASQKKQKLLIFGDYDADGIPATALCMRVLRPYFDTLLPIIPRRRDGYGLTAGSIARILAEKPDVLLCIDNGTVSSKEVAELQKRMDVLIIDHHEVGDHSPAPAHALVNPKQENCTYPFRELCACGLTYKVLENLVTRLGGDPKKLRWELDLVALSTIADMVPLVGENRVLAHFGLKVLRKTRNKGLQALAQAAAIDLATADAATIGFALAPRLNAASRMHSEEDVAGQNIPLQVLVAQNEAGLPALAAQLHSFNVQRQQLVERHCEEAYAQVQEDDSVLVVWGEEWSTGVIGLVASRLCERFHKSALVFAQEDGLWKASARAYGEDSVLTCMQLAAHHMERYGGHQKAGGCTLKAGSHPSGVADALKVHVAPPATMAIKGMPLSLQECTLALIEGIAVLEPFGIGNAAPSFSVEGVVDAVQTMGKKAEHAKISLAQGSVVLPVVKFRFQGALPSVGDTYRAVIRIEKNTWNGVDRVQLMA